MTDENEKLLKKIIKEQKRTNTILQTIVSNLEDKEIQTNYESSADYLKKANEVLGRTGKGFEKDDGNSSIKITKKNGSYGHNEEAKNIDDAKKTINELLDEDTLSVVIIQKEFEKDYPTTAF